MKGDKMATNETLRVPTLDVQTVNSEEKVKYKEKFAFGLGGLGEQLLMSTAASFLMYFYTEVAGIAVAAVGTILLLARILDGVTDLGMGLVVDKTKSRHGKARPWMLWMAVPYCLAIIVLFTSPDFGSTGKIVYAFITYTIAVGIIYTATSIPHSTLISTMTKKQSERGQLAVFRAIFTYVGVILIGVLTMPLVSVFGGGKQGWVLVAAIYGIIAMISFLLVFRWTKERNILATQDKEAIVGPSIKVSLRSLLKNKYWFMVTGSLVMINIIIGSVAVTPYYAQYVLGDVNLVGILTVALQLPLVIGAFLMGPLMKKFRKHHLTLAGFLLTAIGSAFVIIQPESLLIVSIGRAIAGFGLAAPAVAMLAMFADTTDYGEWKTGIRNDGLIFGANSFGSKVGTGIGGWLLGIILTIGGYAGGQATQTAAAISSIKIGFIYIPLVFAILAFILLLFYRLDKLYPKIIEELERKRINN